MKDKKRTSRSRFDPRAKADRKTTPVTEQDVVGLSDTTDEKNNVKSIPDIDFVKTVY